MRVCNMELTHQPGLASGFTELAGHGEATCGSNCASMLSLSKRTLAVSRKDTINMRPVDVPFKCPTRRGMQPFQTGSCKFWGNQPCFPSMCGSRWGSLEPKHLTEAPCGDPGMQDQLHV